jgi:hypothetical protein
VDGPAPGYCVLEKAVAFTGAWLVATQQFIFKTGDLHIAIPESIPPLPGMYRADHAIAIVYPYPNSYSRMLIDVLPAFLAIPAWIWAKSTVYYMPDMNLQLFFDLLLLCGKKPAAAHKMFRSVYAQSLYVPQPWRFMRIWPELVRAMRETILVKFGLEKSVPDKMVIAPRARNRFIANPEQFLNACIKAYPSEQWMFGTLSGRDLEEQIRFSAKMRMAIMLGEAGGANTVWMMQNTVYIEIETRSCGLAFIDVARAVGVKVFVIGPLQENIVQLDLRQILAVVQNGMEFLKTNLPGPR